MLLISLHFMYFFLAVGPDMSEQYNRSGRQHGDETC